jgi:GNAT superfamily N-acetyltransferase
MIRPATIADLPRLLELGARMHAESRYRVLAFSASKLQQTLTALLAGSGGFLWVAESAGEVIGGLAAMCTPHWASDDLMAVDLALFFPPEHRGGVAALRLVNRYRQWARELGAKLTDLGVSTGIEADRTADLFDRIGFPRCGTIHSAES